MCGRYSLVTSAEKIHQQLGPDVELPVELPLNYNVAPTQPALVLTDEAPQALQAYRWGLVPFWAKDLKIGSRMINARSETILDKPAFRQAVRRRRCLVLADSFYEWQRTGGQKIPFRILRPNDELLLFAGIWEQWQPPTGESAVHTFSIITCPPNVEMKPIHDRMPVVLDTSEKQSAWLDPRLADDDITELLHTPPDGVLTMYPVSSQVNNVRNNGPDLHLRAGEA
ncbi:MAG: SOS response-associated peptidase [Lewinella sp.]|nr:SOS response-associated peptidase [Lewinella sp.]